MPEQYDQHILNNGMVLLGEPMEGVASVAFSFILPAGASLMPDGCCGATNVIADWIFRGAGDRDSRQLSDALDGLGLQRAGSIGSSYLSMGAALEASNIAQALELYSDIIQKPGLKDDQFELARQLAMDSVLSLGDDPRQKVMLKLREQFYPDPLGRNTVGDIAELQALTADITRQIIGVKFNLSQTIFSIAGKYDFDEICRQMEGLFSGVEKRECQSVFSLQKKQGGYLHIDNDGAQAHIALMTETVKPTDDDYYNARVAVSVLSGGMSARLFTEVREKRGLCYAIGAKYHGLKYAAGIMCYAGTTPDKAQQTLDVVTGEFNLLREGITEEEINRAKVGLKSMLILQSESSSSRAGAIAGDYYMFGRVRSLDEIKDRIESTTVDSVLEFLRKNIFKDFTIVTIGPKRLDIDSN
jgi:predicted Zn-dependent peptidase